MVFVQHLSPLHGIELCLHVGRGTFNNGLALYGNRGNQQGLFFIRPACRPVRYERHGRVRQYKFSLVLLLLVLFFFFLLGFRVTIHDMSRQGVVITTKSTTTTTAIAPRIHGSAVCAVAASATNVLKFTFTLDVCLRRRNSGIMIMSVGKRLSLARLELAALVAVTLGCRSSGGEQSSATASVEDSR